MLIYRAQLHVLLVDLVDGLSHLIDEAALRGRRQAVHVLLHCELQLEVLMQLDQLMVLVAYL